MLKLLKSLSIIAFFFHYYTYPLLRFVSYSSLSTAKYVPVTVFSLSVSLSSCQTSICPSAIYNTVKQIFIFSMQHSQPLFSIILFILPALISLIQASTLLKFSIRFTNKMFHECCQFLVSFLQTPHFHRIYQSGFT